MTSTQVLITIVVLLVIVAIGAAVWFVTRRRSLQHRFGPEYDRAVAEGDSRLAVERELRERERRHAELELVELDPEARARYSANWAEIQARFLDDPAAAVHDGDELVTHLIAERGYPTGDYEDRVAHLSVEHARTLGHYRDAHEISLISGRGEATTEQLRQALVHYRALFAELLGEDVRPGARTDVPADRDDTVVEDPRTDTVVDENPRADVVDDTAPADVPEPRRHHVPDQPDPADVPHDTPRRS